MSEEPSNIMSRTAQASGNAYMGSAFSHLHYAWPDFETEEDLAEAELWEAISGRVGNNDLFSPLRDPESPLDQGDLQRFEMRTTRMASLSDNCSEFASIPPTPYLQPTISEDHDYDRLSDLLSSLPRPLSAEPRGPWESSDRLSDSLSNLPRPLSTEPGWQGVDTAHNHIACQCCEFEGMMEDRQIQHEERVADVIGKLITRIDELIAQRLPP
ncbi:MAG: hypothetical protein LQ345_006054, partial [Seirophora villosa]